MPCLILERSTEEDYVFYNWYKTDSYVCEVNSFRIKDLQGYRKGYFNNGKQNGKWISYKYYYYDSLGYSRSKNYLVREEYFKKGLRDSIYKIYNKKGKIIYSTYFKNGNGIEKDFHDNGQLYYEIKTRDGYFTDTLRLYNDKGRLQEKLFYKKDSLVYKQKFNTNIVDTIEDGKKVKITYENDRIEKKEFGNETWWYKDGKVNLKSKDTIINGIRKKIQESYNEDYIIKTIYIINNPIIEYESVLKYSKNLLMSEIKVSIDKNGHALETEKTYDEKGNIKAITYRKHKAYLNLKENYVYEKIDYYLSGKKYQWSELIYKNKNIIKNIGRSEEQVQFKELNYYNVKNELIKKDYIKTTSVQSGGGHGSSILYEITEKDKTEYFDKNKLFKTEWYEKGKLVKTELM